MFKLIGAVLIICATTWAGMEASNHFIRRTKQLRIVRESLQALDAEIMYNHTPLLEASRKLAAQLPHPVGTFFKTFSDRLKEPEVTVKNAWQESLTEIWGQTDMKQSEYEILVQFGENLGKHDRFTQQKQILLTLTHLEREESDAREKQKQYEKLMKSLGFLSGLLFIILLL
ncbi:stage III sporulation protein SpoIIIAB [Siminovitchia sp. 179-K 8D1 HS]|uniref:stage III sporulation protein SpoIIIAB n=1 Tax=Siminovitchia sp. 179-K 8D1 HS TaxID=3142385 RepID=UPI00399F86BC